MLLHRRATAIELLRIGMTEIDFADKGVLDLYPTWTLAATQVIRAASRTPTLALIQLTHNLFANN